MPERDSTADLKAIKDRVEWRRTMGGRSSDVHPTLLEMEEDIDSLVAEVERLREALTVVRGLVEPTNGCHAEIQAVVDAALDAREQSA